MILSGCGGKSEATKTADAASAAKVSGETPQTAAEGLNADSTIATAETQTSGLAEGSAGAPTPEGSAEAPVTEKADAELPAAKASARLHPVHMGVWGHVGGTGVNFDMNGTTGSYIPYDIAEAKEYGARRQLKLVSYDPKSGHCVINAYLHGKYIGQFDGTFMEEEGETDDGGTYFLQAYNGLFKSVKGDKLEFNMHFD